LFIPSASLQAFLDEKVAEYNQPGFIENDPICIPHRFTIKQDVEIMGFWASILAWGQRKTIINKCNDLIERMDGVPYEFIRNHQDNDLKRFLTFKHRTFDATDTLYFLAFFRDYYARHDSLEDAFARFIQPGDSTVEKGLVGFRNLFFSLEDAPQRTRKHVSTPALNSACKRINMFLRWMVRKDDNGVDFGIWNQISPAQLVCPCDVHVDRIARQLKLISRKQTDWLTALELTGRLRELDAADPVKYDFALFGLGVMAGGLIDFEV
jgi:uncharacterized protein (TIGR02757 family)